MANFKQILRIHVKIVDVAEIRSQWTYSSVIIAAIELFLLKNKIACQIFTF